jgi:hypothetical protein
MLRKLIWSPLLQSSIIIKYQTQASHKNSNSNNHKLLCKFQYGDLNDLFRIIYIVDGCHRIMS